MRGLLSYYNTAHFRVEVALPLRDPYSSAFNSGTLGMDYLPGVSQLQTGDFEFAVIGRNTDLTVEIINDSPLPCHLTSAEWKGTYIGRSTRMSG